MKPESEIAEDIIRLLIAQSAGADTATAHMVN
jgi:hypothetical protein